MWLLVSSLISNLKYNGMPKCTNKIITTNCLSVTFSFISILQLNFTLRGTVWLQTLLVSFVMCKKISVQVLAVLSNGWNIKELTAVTALICLIIVNQESSAQMNNLEVHVSSNMTKKWWLQSFSRAWIQTQSHAENNIDFEISESVLLFNSCCLVDEHKVTYWCKIAASWSTCSWVWLRSECHDWWFHHFCLRTK